MLDDFKNLQPEFYNIVSKMILQNNRISHAYFIETSNVSNANEIVIAFVKILICKNHYENLDSCTKACNTCSLIDNGTYNDLYIVNPDGQWIKKEQILALKEELSNKSLENNLRIYIINNADRLNKSAANSMLKFLEEPEENIIGILVATNKYNVINTILSRCQILKLNSDIKDLDNTCLVDNMFDFILNIERNGLKTICYVNELWNSKYTKKDEVSNNIVFIKELYMEIINYKLGKNIRYNNHIDDINYVASKNDIDTLIRKIQVITTIQNDLEYNANSSLLMDKLIIDLVGGDNYEKVNNG